MVVGQFTIASQVLRLPRLLMPARNVEIIVAACCSLVAAIVRAQVGGFLVSLPLRQVPFFTEAYLLLPWWAFVAIGVTGLLLAALARGRVVGRAGDAGLVIALAVTAFMLLGILALSYPFGDVYMLGEPGPKLG